MHDIIIQFYLSLQLFKYLTLDF